MNKEEYIKNRLKGEPSSPLAKRLQNEARERDLAEEQERIRQERQARAKMFYDFKVAQFEAAGCDEITAKELAEKGLKHLYFLTACNDTNITEEIFLKVIGVLCTLHLPSA